MIFELKQYEGGLSEAEQYRRRLDIALRVAKICVFEVDLEKQLYTFFANAKAIFGVSGEKILADVQPFSGLPGEEYRDKVSRYFSHPDDFEVIEGAFAAIFQGESVTYEARMRAGGTDYIWCKLDVSPILRDGVPVKMIGVITNIEEEKKHRRTLEKAADLDGFTGLYNKTASIARIKDLLRQKPEQRHALVLMDIDTFKSFNDTYGHAAGDEVISMVAETIKNFLRGTDISGRYGGDEFILLMSDIPDVSKITHRLQRLLSCKGETFSCTNSIGVAVYPEDGRTFEELFGKADAALYHSKASRGTLTCFGSMEK